MSEIIICYQKLLKMIMIIQLLPIDQLGRGSLNNIKIDENALNKTILKIRYLNGRKLNNQLLKNDYKISKNMKGAIKFNKNNHKLSFNEKIFTMN